jgi:2-oxo-hept-3-ene-1,7-dioate hydratase
MLTQEQIERTAVRLDDAERMRQPIRILSAEYPGMTIADAYAVQRAWIARKLESGRVIKGHKIGLTSKAMQNAVNIREPDYGALLDDMFFADGDEIPTERFIAPRVEAELAFILRRPLSGPDCSLFDVLNASDYVVPAMEILDVRVQRVDPEGKATRKVSNDPFGPATERFLPIEWRPVTLYMRLRRCVVLLLRAKTLFTETT